jgi:chaperonin cofactor prefoldin
MAEESALDILKKYRAPAADAGEARDQAAMAAQMRSRAGLPEQSSFIGDVLGRQFLGQGVLMGAGDEAEAAARSLARGTRYDDELAYVRQKNAITRAERPIASTAAEITGGLAPALAATVATGGAAAPVIAGARTAGLAGQIGRMAGTGAAVGGVQGGVEGFLKGEGSAAARLDKAAEEAVQGALFGGAVGAAFPAGAAAYRAVTRPPEQLAAGVLQRSLQQEGMTVDDLLRAYQQRQATGVKPEIASEVLPPGSALEAQARLVAQTPGAQRAGVGQQLQERAAGQTQRLEEEFTRAIGQQKNIFASLDELAATRAEIAKPLYAKVDPMVARSDELDALIKKVPNSVFSELESVADIRGITPATIIKRNEKNAKEIARDYTFAEVDSIQRALDDAASAAYRDGKGNLGGDLKSLRDAIVASAEKQNADYKQARAIWSDTRAAERQMMEGQKVFKTRPELIEKSVKDMSPSDKDAYLVGVFDAFSGVLNGRVTGEDVTRAFRTGRAKQQMEAAIKAAWNDPAEAKRVTDNLFANIEREARMSASKNKLLGGSQTAQTLTQQESNLAAMSPLAAMAQEMAAGGPTIGMIGRAAQGVGQAIQKGLTPARQEAANEQLRKVLFARSEADLRRELEAMQAMLAARQYTAPTGARALVPGLLGGALNQ